MQNNIQKMYNNQRELQILVARHGTVERTVKEIAKDYNIAIIGEVAEAIEEYRLSGLSDAYIEELSDVFIFLLDEVLLMQDIFEFTEILCGMIFEVLTAIEVGDAGSEYVSESKKPEELLYAITMHQTKLVMACNFKWWKQEKPIVEEDVVKSLRSTLYELHQHLVNNDLVDKFINKVLEKQKINIDRQLGKVDSRADYAVAEEN